MAKIMNFLLIIILIGSVGFLGYKFYELSPQEKQGLNIFLTNSELPATNASSELVMFMPNMRFNTNRISYYFSDCELVKQARVLEAFSLVSSGSQDISFYEVMSEENAKIKIYCSGVKKPTRNNSFVAGEGGPDSLINLSLYPLINSGQIYLYGTQGKNQCDSPIVETHELMHVFGFDHLADKESVLYPYVSCEQKLIPGIVSELKRLYSFEAKSDLWIKKANVSEGGIYLNFEITIENRGLISANNVELEIYDRSNNNKIGNFSMRTLEPGMSNTITLENFRLPSRNTNDLKFMVKTQTPEFFYENNEFVVKLN
jgi:hypothetical protein